MNRDLDVAVSMIYQQYSVMITAAVDDVDVVSLVPFCSVRGRGGVVGSLSTVENLYDGE